MQKLQTIRFAAFVLGKTLLVFHHDFIASSLRFPVDVLAHFFLYSRSYCHLCDDMLQALQSLSNAHFFTVEVVDVDHDERLVAQYDELVPVLVGKKMNGELVQICNYFLDEAKVIAFFETPQLSRNDSSL